ncbi:zinc finger MYM-type protein 1-like, partial [Aphis craccivora]
MDYNNGLYFIEHYKDVTYTSIDFLKSEMIVAKNCLARIKENFDIDDIKQVVTEGVGTDAVGTFAVGTFCVPFA